MFLTYDTVASRVLSGLGREGARRDAGNRSERRERRTVIPEMGKGKDVTVTSVLFSSDTKTY